MTGKPALLFYCQHAIGMGHLVRSLALAAALAEHFRVILLSGGRVPRGMPLPPDVDVRPLPPLALDENNQLISCDRRWNVQRAQAVRRERILAAYDELQPAAVVIELFPFGRKKFTPELLPLLQRARQRGHARPVVACSLRDILVSRPGDQQRHDARAVAIANEYFDVLLVHADPRLARLEETFYAASDLRIPIEYTGFVLPQHEHAPPTRRKRRIVVSAGGGLVGEPLFRAALDAQPLLWSSDGVGMDVVAGPFLPESVWDQLRRDYASRAGVALRRFVPNLQGQFQTAAGSVSQCGYNTALDLVSSRVPALVVPYTTDTEDEQMRRARRLEALGAVRVLPPDRLEAATLACEMHRLLHFQPQPVSIDLEGAAHSARIVRDMVAAS